uniref:Subunit of the COMPASS complex n=1 Tax=Nakaseomyces delphensis TaxID=51657 RepID=A7WPH6_NAKDE|nr:subunit of the COMPASS complex [Nakaseomyces delphensis]
MNIHDVVTQDTADQQDATDQQDSGIVTQRNEVPLKVEESMPQDTKETIPNPNPSLESVTEQTNPAIGTAASLPTFISSQEGSSQPQTGPQIQPQLDPHTLQSPEPVPQLKQEMNGLVGDTKSKLDLVNTIGGSQTRRYLNEYVTPALLDGMRQIAIKQPENPLRVLGEYLIARSEDTK